MNFESIEKPIKQNFLVGFGDLSRFMRLTSETEGNELFAMLSEWYELVGDIADDAGGRVIKCIGDAVLVVYPEDKADEGVLGFLEMAAKSKEFFAEKGISTKLKVTLHFGEAVLGKTGPRSEKRLDILGKAVDVAAVLETSNTFAMSAAVFRQLSPKTRKLFKKHTPPITYIPVEEKHRN